MTAGKSATIPAGGASGAARASAAGAASGSCPTTIVRQQHVRSIVAASGFSSAGQQHADRTSFVNEHTSARSRACSSALTTAIKTRIAAACRATRRDRQRTRRARSTTHARYCSTRSNANADTMRQSDLSGRRKRSFAQPADAPGQPAMCGNAHHGAPIPRKFPFTNGHDRDVDREPRGAFAGGATGRGQESLGPTAGAAGTRRESRRPVPRGAPTMA